MTHETLMTADQSEEELFIALGRAASKLWSNLPQEIQHTLFDQAVSFRGDDKATSCDISSWQAFAHHGRSQGGGSAGARQSRRVGHSSLTGEDRISKYFNCFVMPRPSPRACA
jgi:hypothetical protein